MDQPNAVQVVPDAVSYGKPFDSVIPSCHAEYVAASKERGGDIEARLAAVLEDAATFKRFVLELTRLAETNTFDRLPRFRRGDEHFSGVHYLTVGPWRGVYLVSASTRIVYGILFTKFPHNVRKRDFDEILARNQALTKSPDAEQM